MLPCPACQSPVGDRAFACAACTLAVRREGERLVPVYPLIRPSAWLYEGDLRAALPLALVPEKVMASGTLRVERTPEGLQVAVAPHKALSWAHPFMRLRDACVALRVASASGSARITLMARSSDIGTFRKSYGFMLRVPTRELSLVRSITGGIGQPAVLTELTPRVQHPAARALGVGSVLEMRVQGPVLEGWIDGQRVAVHHDPVLGIGQAGFRVEAEGDVAAHATFASVAIAGVLP